jgi:hypothetical protein
MFFQMLKKYEMLKGGAIFSFLSFPRAHFFAEVAEDVAISNPSAFIARHL